MANEKIFISYSRKDKDYVFKVRDIIEQELNTKCWIDLNGIESDQQFVDVIIAAINKLDIFLFMYSKNAAASPWTQKELRFASAKKKRIVIINADKTPLEDWFLFEYGGHDIIDFDNLDQRKKLIKNLRDWLPELPKATSNNVVGSYNAHSAIETGTQPKDIDESKDREIKDNNSFLSKIKSIFVKPNKTQDVAKKQETSVSFESSLSVDDSAFRSEITIERKRTPAKPLKIDISNFSLEQIDDLMMQAEHLKARNRESEAFEIYKKIAETGNSKAQYELGKCYDQGIGTEVDQYDAILWYKKAEAQGENDARIAVQQLEKKNFGRYKDKYGVVYRMKKPNDMIPTILSTTSDHYREEAIDTYIVREGTTQIENGAFDIQRKITKLVIPSSIKVIKGSTFNNCIIHNIEFKEGLETIKDEAFKGCHARKIVLPSTLKSIGAKAFGYSEQLQSIELGNRLETIGDDAFRGCKSLQSIVLPDSLKNIGNNAFRGCSCITKVHLPNKLVSIGDYAFKCCKLSKEIIYVPDSITQWGDHALEPGTLYVPRNRYDKIKSKTDWSTTYIKIKQ